MNQRKLVNAKARVKNHVRQHGRHVTGNNVPKQIQKDIELLRQAGQVEFVGGKAECHSTLQDLEALLGITSRG